ncbi:MAG: glycosyltransferase family 39 protein [Patescibacteria group bacterium]
MNKSYDNQLGTSGHPALDNRRKWRTLQGWRPYLVILVLGFLLYGRTIFFDFTYLDDNSLILENYPIISSFRNIGAVFSQDVFFGADKFYYRPLLNLSFMIDAAIAGALPAIFHLSNILWHVLAASLVFSLFLKERRPRHLAFFLALIFLVHPVMSQAVAWIPGRNDSLLAVFVLVSFLSFLSFSERPRLGAYIAYLLFFLAALLTKETAIFLPILVVFYFLFITPNKVSLADRWLLVIGSAATGFLWFLARHFALGGETTNYIAAGRNIFQNAPALLVYIGKLVWPFNLAVFPILADSRLFYGALALPALIIAWWRSRSARHIYFVFGSLWFMLFLLPSFIRVSGLPDFLEHRLYLPFIGFLIFLAELAWFNNLDFSRKNVKMISAALLLVLAGVTWQHSALFRDRLTFWQAAVLVRRIRLWPIRIWERCIISIKICLQPKGIIVAPWS